MDHPPPLPAPGPLLLRALFKRARATTTVDGPASTTYLASPTNQKSLASYRQLIGFDADALPLTFHYLLAQRAQLASMLGAGFPFRIPGMIHVANELIAHDALDPARPMLLHTSASIAPPQANGAIHVLFRTTGQQDGRDIFSCASDYLAVRGRRGARSAPPPVSHTAPIASWKLDSAAGRRYAAVSGDWNPIHLSHWTAKLMGMRTPIIHGMHTVGACCAALEHAAGRRVAAISSRFTAPIALPGQVTLSADLEAGEYTASSGGRDAVIGSFRLA
ncbi:MaoC/PaaZ C-terminal domain-containing protein [Massilia terrae]|uniref:MaoC/PaaZ C-terminal domain-containing protein n=1 Tax=Massilia terrae TaxID=1811224 RepID=A0ABT2CTJ7_9BURK|nr:MaoC/PaaZ C-terminal domain-containing protein [Massilia terrae]MCS0657298.1 MaoC/PaaZ C-terminal domain-containing protein [Massilia terrae]